MKPKHLVNKTSPLATSIAKCDPNKNTIHTLTQIISRVRNKRSSTISSVPSFSKTSIAFFQHTRSFSNLPRINDSELRKLVFTTEREAQYQLRRAVKNENEKQGVQIALPFQHPFKSGFYKPDTDFSRGKNGASKQGTINVPGFMIDHLLAPYHNRRLELLGDSLLELIITEELLKRFDMIPIGNIAYVRNQILKNDTFKRISLYIYKLRNYLVKSGNSGIDIDVALKTRETTSNDEQYYMGIATAADADLFEAYVGGLFLDLAKTTTWENAIEFIKKWLLEIAEPIISQYKLEQQNQEKIHMIADHLSRTDTKEFMAQFDVTSSKIKKQFKYLYSKYDNNIFFPKISSSLMETRILTTTMNTISLLPKDVRQFKYFPRDHPQMQAVISFCLHFNNEQLIFLSRSLIKFLLCSHFYQRYPGMNVQQLAQNISLSTQALPSFEKKHLSGLVKANEEVNINTHNKFTSPWSESKVNGGETEEDEKWGLFFRAYLGGLYLSEKQQNEDKRAFGVVKQFFFQTNSDYGHMLFVKQPEIKSTTEWDVVKSIYKRHMNQFEGPDPLLRASGVSDDAFLNSKWEKQQFNDYREKRSEELHLFQTKKGGLVEIPLINQNIGLSVYPLSCQQLATICRILLPNNILPKYLTDVKMFNSSDGTYDYIVTCQIGDIVISRAIAKDLNSAQQLSAEAALRDQYLLNKSISKILGKIPFSKTKLFMKRFMLRLLNLYHTTRVQENNFFRTDGNFTKPEIPIPIKKDVKTVELLNSQSELNEIVQESLNMMFFPEFKLLSSGLNGENSNVPAPPFTVACTLRDVKIGIGIGIEMEYAKSLAASAALERPELMNWVLEKTRRYLDVDKYIQTCEYVMNTFTSVIDEELEKKGDVQLKEESLSAEYREFEKKILDTWRLEMVDEQEFEDSCESALVNDFEAGSEPVISFAELDNLEFLEPIRLLDPASIEIEPKDSKPEPEPKSESLNVVQPTSKVYEPLLQPPDSTSQNITESKAETSTPVSQQSNVINPQLENASGNSVFETNAKSLPCLIVNKPDPRINLAHPTQRAPVTMMASLGNHPVPISSSSSSSAFSFNSNYPISQNFLDVFIRRALPFHLLDSKCQVKYFDFQYKDLRDFHSFVKTLKPLHTKAMAKHLEKSGTKFPLFWNRSEQLFEIASQSDQSSQTPLSPSSSPSLRSTKTSDTHINLKNNIINNDAFWSSLFASFRPILESVNSPNSTVSICTLDSFPISIGIAPGQHRNPLNAPNSKTSSTHELAQQDIKVIDAQHVAAEAALQNPDCLLRVINVLRKEEGVGTEKQQERVMALI